MEVIKTCEFPHFLNKPIPDVTNAEWHEIRKKYLFKKKCTCNGEARIWKLKEK